MVIIPKLQKNVPVNNSHLKVHVHERGKERQEKYMSVHIQVYTAYIRLHVHVNCMHVHNNIYMHNTSVDLGCEQLNLQ